MRRLLLALLVLTIVVAAWIVGTMTPLAMPSERGADGKDVSAADGQVSAEDVAERRRRADSQAAALPTAIDPADAARMVQVLVLDPDGRPVPGAEVWYWAAMLGVNPAWTSHSEPIADLQRYGRSARADDRGVARWPWLFASSGANPDRGSRWSVAARHSGGSGFLDFPASARPSVVHELRLKRDRSLQARVIGADGASVPGVLVWLETVAAISTSYRDTGILNARIATDSQGMVTFDCIDAVLSDRSRRRQSEWLRVSVDLPSLDVRVQVDPAALPSRPLLLQLPPMGELELSLRDFDGLPMPENTFIALCVREQSDSVAVCRCDRHGVVLTPVPLGEEWAVNVPGRIGTRVRVEGPKTAGERVRATIISKPHRVLIGQLMLNGRPAEAARVTREDRLRWLSVSDVVSDAEGRFRLHEWSSEGEVLEELPEVALAISMPDGARYRFVHRKAVPATAGLHDLGVLQLQGDVASTGGEQALPILCSGQVSSRRDLGDVNLRVVPAAKGRNAHEPELEFDRATGNFTFRGSGAGGHVELLHRWDCIARVPFAAGQTDLVVPFEPGRELVATLQSEDLELLDLVLASLVREGKKKEDRVGAGEREPSPSGARFRWEQLARGRYRLEVKVAGLLSPLVVLRDLEVTESGPCTDARLQAIVLPRCDRLRIDVHAPDPFARDFEVSVFAKGREPVSCLRHRDGYFLVPHDGPVDLAIARRGCRTEVLRGVTSDRSVQLSPGIEVTLHVDQQSEKPVRVRLAFEGDDLPPQESSEACPPGRQAIRIVLPAPGRYAISGYSDSAEPLEANPEAIDVGNGGGTFDIVLRRE